jgi:hypothetical protein
MGQGMMVIYIVIAATGVLGLTASGVALFVSLSLRAAIAEMKTESAQAQNAMFDKLDIRYYRREEQIAAKEAATAANVVVAASDLREEEHYRTYAGRELSALQVQVFQNKEDVTILLRNALAELKKDL